MAEEGKKISFGFAKSIKKPTLVKQELQEKKKVDYIECFDEKTIKVIGKEQEETAQEVLAIALLQSKAWHERLVNRINVDIFEPKTVDKDNLQAVKVKEEPTEEVSNGDITSINKHVSNIQIKAEPPDESKSKILTLEEQAAKEIIEDLKSTGKKEELSDLTLPLTEEQNLKGGKESTLEDYEMIPIDAFGLAMLRGMGWKSDEGIGKNGKVVTATIPELRPKGMGLGVDKAALKKLNEKSQKVEEELQMKKGSFVKIIVGKQANAYGQIEGFDDDAGRLIVKMAVGGNTISINECTVQLVTKADYMKNSKVLNATKYEEYKNREGASKRKLSSESFDSSDNNDLDIPDKKRRRKKDGSRHKSKKSSKKSKSRQRDLSDSDNDSKRKSNRRRSSSSNDAHKLKKAKKTKKHKGRDKERERRKDKKSRSSNSPDRRKSKKHKRSRSSSRQ